MQPNCPLRRGRSETAYIFHAQPAGLPFLAQQPYSILQHLKEENLRVIIREDVHWVHRGNLCPESPDDTDTEEPARGRSRRMRDARQGAVFAPPVRNQGLDSSPEGYTDRDSSPEGVTDRNSSPESDSHTDTDLPSSPAPLEAVLDAMDISPADNAMDCDSDADQSIVSVSPTVSDFLTGALTEISTSSTGGHRTLITYLSRNRDRFRLQLAEDAVQAQRLEDVLTITDAVGSEDAEYSQRVEDFLSSGDPDGLEPPTRRSRRLRVGRAGDSTQGCVWTTADLLALELQVYDCVIQAPRPLVDIHNYVVGVVAPGPKKDIDGWLGVVATAHQEMRRLYRNGSFAHFGERETIVRVGLDCGMYGPYIIDNLRDTRHETYHLLRSDTFQTISAYQNHLYCQFAPSLAAHSAGHLDQLKDRNLHPPFKHSLFTTAEWSFGDAASPPRKHETDLFYTFCAVTAIGRYPASRGQVIIWKDGAVIPFIPGTTILFPAGCQSYSFAAVKGNESRFYFKQYFKASLMQWLDRDHRSTAQFDALASAEELVRDNELREHRGDLAGSLYSKLNNLFVI